MGKEKNRVFLIKVQVVKILFYPAIVVLDRLGLIRSLYSPMEKLTRFLGIQKSINSLLQYHDYSECFKDDFRGIKSTGKKVLFPSLLGVNSNFTMLDLLFAKYYARKGYSPAFVVCNSAIDICQKENVIRSRRFNPMFCHECWKGFRDIAAATGIEVLYLGSFINKNIEGRIAKVRDQIGSLQTINEMLGYRFEDMPAGELSYKSVLRFFLKGSLTGTAQELQIFKNFLQSTVTIGLLFEELLAREPQTEKVVIPNGTLALEAIIRYKCERKHIPYMTFENYMGENTVIYKKNDEVMKFNWDREMADAGNLGISSQDKREKVDRFFTELRVGRHKYAVLNREQDKMDFSGYGRFVCAFTNLNFDTAVIGRHHVFNDMEDWLTSLADFWKNNHNDIKLIIRVHPAEVKMRTGTREFMGDRLRERIRSDNIILIDSTEKVNAYDLIDQMEYGLIYSSTIGIEIAHVNKVCVIAGKPYFINKPFVITPSSREDYFNTLTLLNRKEYNYKPDKNALDDLVYYVFYNRLKQLHGIKIFTLNAEKNTNYEKSEGMLNENLGFFEEFDKEFSGITC